MIPSLRQILALSAVLLGTAFSRAAEVAELPPLVTDFFDLNCYECHNAVDREGELDLESLVLEPAKLADRSLWAMIHDRVRDQEMPPKEDSLVEPAERADFLTVLEDKLHQASSSYMQEVGRVHSRRLNRIEFENTLHDLIGVKLPLLEYLPEDQDKHGFTNVADSQQISHHLLAKYLEVIDRMLDQAFHQVLESPAQYYEAFEPHQLGVGRERIPNERMALYDADRHLLVSYPTTYGFHGRMPDTTVDETGWYRITVTAKSLNAPPGRSVWSHVITGMLRAKTPMTYWAGMIEATPEFQTFTFDAWIQEQHMIGIRPVDNTLEWVPTKQIRDNVVLDTDAVAIAVKNLTMERIYPGMETTELHQNLFGDLTAADGELLSEDAAGDLLQLLHDFAEKAFRRPVSADDLEPYWQFAATELAASGSLRAAVRAGYRAILCSHRFIYFIEDGGRLDDHAIASRLSYLLWSSMPDQELRQLADTGKLNDPAVLGQQVDRMLAHEKSAAFVQNFAASWLDLRDITFTTPDAELYPEFDEILLQSMLDETHAFLDLMIEEDLSVANVVDADFTVLNERLAQHYGVDFVPGQALQKVSFASNDPRGGIITQASVLKVTANGTTTSPIVRGVWLLERILGIHIPPPPDQVPAIEPDIRGAVSIRDQMDKHRSIESCMSCHIKIDPPGFALENFDVIGGWRDHYRAKGEKGKLAEGPIVDPSYTMPDGRPFADFNEFQTLVLQDQDKLAGNLLKQVLTYATGAEITFGDRREVDQLVAQISESDYGFRSLIHAAVQSDIFLSK